MVGAGITGLPQIIWMEMLEHWPGTKMFTKPIGLTCYPSTVL